MNKWIVFLLLTSFSVVGFSQNKILLTGRPLSDFDRNVKEIAGKKFNIIYEYVAFNSTPSQLDSINAVNNVAFSKLEKKQGSDWRTKLSKMETEERSNLSLFQSMLIKEGKANSMNLLLYSKSKCGKSYRVKVYQDKDLPSTEQEVIKQYVMKVKEGKAVIK